MAMAAAHEAQYHLTYADTSIAPPASRHDGIYTPSEDLHGQAYESDSHSYLDNTSTSVPYQSGDERAVCGVSPRDTQATRPDAIANLHLVDEDTTLDAAESLKSPSRTKDYFRPEKDCPTRRNFRSTRLTWLSGTIIFISSVSTALSALFVVLALKGQRYGNYIGNDPGAKISISAAILWTSVLAKTIELSFVTAFVAFLGQKISRRAMTDSKGRGVSISELSMWRWVVQPGSIFTSSEIARYAGFSTLGTLTLISTILSTLYVTAATALVQPVAKHSDWHKKTMVGSVKSDFANINYVKSLCQTPIADTEAGDICMQAESAGKSFYNLAQFLAHWEDVVDVKGARNKQPQEQKHRPTWIGLPYANARIVPQWIHVVDTAEASRRYNRVINNVSLALPHIGVSNAAHDQRNHMPQSDTSDSIEPYSLWASVPSPVMKVLCVHMNETELEPIIYDAWPNSNLNVADWTRLPGPRDNATTTNKTVVDELFGWATEDKDTTLDYPPVFARYPLPFNTIVNHTSFAWGRTAIYLLGQGGPKDLGSDLTGVYPLCKLEVEITPLCSTLHTVSSSDTTAEALCEDRASNMAYSQNAENDPDATRTQVLENWRDMGTTWANTISLGTGLMDSNDSLQRTLMSLALDPEESNPSSIQVKLDPLLPSLAETLAITASDTILMSLQDGPFVNEWVSDEHIKKRLIMHVKTRLTELRTILIQYLMNHRRSGSEPRSSLKSMHPEVWTRHQKDGLWFSFAPSFSMFSCYLTLFCNQGL